MTSPQPFRITWWDRFLMGVAPSWGLRRVQARASVRMMARHYDAARTGRRTSGWHRRSTDANAAHAPALASLRELSRDLRRNNGWARRGIQTIASNTVGWGIEAKAQGVDPELGAHALQLWRDWADTVRCDFDGRLPFSGIQRLVMNTVVESGEALVVRERAGSGDNLPVPIRVRVLEPDYLDTLKEGKGAAGPIVQGVELDGRGRRVAYWLHTHHPGATHYGARVESQRVEAADVLHIYRVERPGQLRGVPWLASAIAKLHDLDDYDDAKLMQAKIAACFGAFVQDMDGQATGLGDVDADDDQLETLEPGHIEYLPPGKSVTFATPPSTSDHGPFTTTQLRRIAAALGVTYESISGDFSQVNFSSARMARLEHWANVYDWRWNMVIPQLCNGVWSWVMEMAGALQGWKATPSASWSPPPMPMLEPDKEGLAYTRLVRSGAMTFYEMIRERGEDPATHLAEIAEGNAQLDALGIVLDSDPRRTSAAGLYQPPAAAGDQAE